MSASDVRHMVKTLRKSGYQVEMLKGSKHWEVRDPHGRRVTTFSNSPSDTHWLKNTVSYVRKFEREQGIGLKSPSLSDSVPSTNPMQAATRALRKTRGGTHVITITVATGDTLSGIASAHGESLSAIEAANPQITNPDVIHVGDKVIVLGGDTSSTPPAPASSSSTPSAPSPSSVPSSTSPSSSTTSSSGFHIPGMPDSMASCIAFRESTSGQASSNVFGIIPASGFNVSGQSLAQQEATAGQIYATTGGSAWAADGCPGT